MRLFVRRHRQVLILIAVMMCVAGLIYVGVRGQSGRQRNIVSDTYAGQAMGTAVKKTLFGESVADLEDTDHQIDLCLRNLEKHISVRVTDSEVAKFNRNYVSGGIYTLSSDILGYLRREMEIYDSSKGAFSPCIRPIAELWGIEDGKTQVPEADSIVQTLACCNGDDIQLKDDGVVFDADHMAIDFGAVGKGIAGDEVYALLEESPLTGAVVSIGGTVVVYGEKDTGKEWHVGIQNPRGEDGDVFGILDVEGGNIISTSGDYEKYFEMDGKRYHHIFDPATGYPADSGLMSVSVISKDGFLSDALSTACFVMGLEDGMSYAEEQGVEAIFVTTDKKVYVTDGIKKKFRIQKDEYELEKQK